MHKITMLLVATALCSLTISAQEDNDLEDLSQYFKQNSLIQEFSRVGVTSTQYAKRIKYTNIQDQDRTVRIIIIGKEEFRDDGQKHDAEANDGILTSTELFGYSSKDQILRVGEVKSDPNGYTLMDEEMSETSIERLPIFPKIKIRCKFKWLRCSEMPYPVSQMCFELGPPYGTLKVYDCDIELSFF